MAGNVSGAENPHETLRQRGVQLFQDRSWREALACFDQLAHVEPNDAQIQNLRARSFEGLGDYEQALKCLDEALRIDPENLSDLRNRAIVLRKLGRLAEALASFEAVLARRPDDVDLLIRRAMLLNELDRREEALASVEHAARIRPGNLEVLNARVIILDNLGRYREALSDLDQMLGIQPNHTDAVNNTGMILARLGRFKEALACYDRSLAIQPDQPQARYNRSLVRLALGDWIRGFKEFECRWQTPPLSAGKLKGLGALWLGDEDLQHKTLLVYHEQGYGDTLQCVRYLPAIAERGARVILAVPPALQNLMTGLPGVTAVLSGGAALPAHDYQTPLMSLPLAFRTTPDTIPSNTPYLRADPVRNQVWRQRLGKARKPRIGLVWGGRRYAPINYPRDLPLERLLPLLSLDAEFISVEKDITETDLATLAQSPQIRRFDEFLEDFADTAALLDYLDLLISVDTAVAHLAGALGKPVWLLNRYASCWRWLQTGAESPWYPSMRIFRQTTVGDWDDVLAAVQLAAADFVAAWPKCAKRISPKALHLATMTPPTEVPAKSPTRQKIRFVCASRLSREEFFTKAPLGRSLPVYRTFPKGQVIELRLFANNREGLSSVYNLAIEEANADPAILVFCHDDVYLSDYYWAEHLHAALDRFDLVGLAGNRRRVLRQASWMFLDDEFLRDNYDNLSGVIGHGNPFPDLKQLSVYGEPGHAVQLLDGVLMAVRSSILIERDLRFDPQFKFHFYDMDFCRQAEIRHLRMGTCALSIVHASAGTLGVDSWRAAYRDYLTEYGES